MSQADAVVLAPGGAAAIVGFPKTILASIISSGGFDPTDYSLFQALFRMTVIIALEFNRSLLVVADRQHGIIQVRTVILIALLAIVRS